MITYQLCKLHLGYSYSNYVAVIPVLLSNTAKSFTVLTAVYFVNGQLPLSDTN